MGNSFSATKHESKVIVKPAAVSLSIDPALLVGLNEHQIRGMAAGLTREQVNHAWFSYEHAEAAKKRIPYEQYRGLSYEEVDGILKGLSREQVVGLTYFQIRGIKAGLTREQVNHKWFSYTHAEAAERKIPYEQYRGLSYEEVDGILQGLSRKQVVGLDEWQIRGMLAGLTREQVNHAWFSIGHAEAAEKKIPYKRYNGLSNMEASGISKGLSKEQLVGLNDDQIQGMIAGLTREQVNHAWFSNAHAYAAEKKIPYQVFAGLAQIQVNRAVKAYESAKDKGLKFGLTKTQLEALSTKGILAITDHGMKFEQVMAIPGSGLDEALRLHRVNQALSFCMSQYDAVGERARGKEAPMALKVPDVFETVCAFLGKPRVHAPAAPCAGAGAPGPA